MTSTSLLDTSTVVLLSRIEDAGALPDEPLVSTVTLAELAVGPSHAGSGRPAANWWQTAGKLA